MKWERDFSLGCLSCRRNRKETEREKEIKKKKTTERADTLIEFAVGM